MARIITFVVSAVSALALSTAAAPALTTDGGVFDLRTGASTTRMGTGNWCC